jgi:hypothetical protein
VHTDADRERKLMGRTAQVSHARVVCDVCQCVVTLCVCVLAGVGVGGQSTAHDDQQTEGVYGC